MPRPKQRPSTHRTNRVVFRMTDAELVRLSQQAAAQSITVNRLARRLVLSGTQKQTTQSHDPALIKQLYHIGHNLNQLVKNAHIFGRISPRIEQLCQRIETLMNEATEKE